MHDCYPVHDYMASYRCTFSQESRLLWDTKRHQCSSCFFHSGAFFKVTPTFPLSVQNRNSAVSYTNTNNTYSETAQNEILKGWRINSPVLWVLSAGGTCILPALTTAKHLLGAFWAAKASQANRGKAGAFLCTLPQHQLPVQKGTMMREGVTRWKGGKTGWGGGVMGEKLKKGVDLAVMVLAGSSPAAAFLPPFAPWICTSEIARAGPRRPTFGRVAHERGWITFKASQSAPSWYSAFVFWMAVLVGEGG